MYLHIAREVGGLVVEEIGERHERILVFQVHKKPGGRMEHALAGS